MLAAARRKAAAQHLSVRFEEGDAEQLAFPPGSFDLVISRHVLWTLPHPEAAIDEWMRVLRPGGRLAVIDGQFDPGFLTHQRENARTSAEYAAIGDRLPFLGIPAVLSNQASIPMEHVSAAMTEIAPDASRWFQLYWSSSDALVSSLVQRAERSGCEAIVVTLDTHVLGWRPRDLDLGYLPFSRGRGIAQYTRDAELEPIDDRLVRDWPGRGGAVQPPARRPALRRALFGTLFSDQRRRR